MVSENIRIHFSLHSKPLSIRIVQSGQRNSFLWWDREASSLGLLSTAALVGASAPALRLPLPHWVYPPLLPTSCSSSTVPLVSWIHLSPATHPGLIPAQKYVAMLQHQPHTKSPTGREHFNVQIEKLSSITQFYERQATKSSQLFCIWMWISISISKCCFIFFSNRPILRKQLISANYCWASLLQTLLKLWRPLLS